MVAVVQIKFDIPDALLVGIVHGGSRSRHRGIMRAVNLAKDAKIVGLFGDGGKAAPVPQAGVAQAKAIVAPKVKAVGVKAMGAVKMHPKAAIIVGAGAVVAGAGAIGVGVWKKHEPKELQSFRVDLKAYIDCLCIGQMTSRRVITLINDIDVLKNHKHYAKISTKLITIQFETLVDRIKDYTRDFADVNAVELLKEELQETVDALSDLQTYLKAQKRVFEKNM